MKYKTKIFANNVTILVATVLKEIIRITVFLVNKKLTEYLFTANVYAKNIFMKYLIMHHVNNVITRV